jgi:hypothetical protein
VETEKDSNLHHSEKEKTMSNPSKKVASDPRLPGTKGVPALGVAVASKVTGAATPDFSKQIAELQKKSLDMAAAQNAEWNSFWKTVVKRFQVASPNAPLVTAESASQAFQTAIKTHKTAIDLVVKRKPGFVVSGQPGGNAYSKYGDSLSALIKKSFEQSLKAQKKLQELTAKQNKLGKR